MTMSGVHKAQIIVAGEASESDDEVEDNLKQRAENSPIVTDTADTSLTRQDGQRHQGGSAGVVVSGEASESDEEGLNTVPSDVPQLKGEKNAFFADHLHEFAATLYSKAAKDIRVVAQHLSKSQAMVQEVSHCMRLLTNDLFQVEDKIDIVAKCNILPDIEIEIADAAAAGGDGSSTNSSAKSSPSR